MKNHYVSHEKHFGLTSLSLIAHHGTVRHDGIFQPDHDALPDAICSAVIYSIYSVSIPMTFRRRSNHRNRRRPPPHHRFQWTFQNTVEQTQWIIPSK